MKKTTNTLKKRRMRFPNVANTFRELVHDIQDVDNIVNRSVQMRQLRNQPLSPSAMKYEREFLEDVRAPSVRRLTSRYRSAKQKLSAFAKPLVGFGAVAGAYNATQQPKVQLKKGLVNPTLHAIRQANPARTRQAIKYPPSTYAQSVEGMAGTGYNRDSNKLRQLQEDATTLSTGGRPNPEHNNKRFYGLFGLSAVNEPQKAMTMTQRQQRLINQSFRQGHANRRIAKSAIQKSSYSNSFVSGAAVDPNMIVQPKKGRRFKGQTMGMSLVSKRAKTIRKEEQPTQSRNAFGLTDEQKQLGDKIAYGALGTSIAALAGLRGMRALRRSPIRGRIGTSLGMTGAGSMPRISAGATGEGLKSRILSGAKSMISPIKPTTPVRGRVSSLTGRPMPSVLSPAKSRMTYTSSTSGGKPIAPRWRGGKAPVSAVPPSMWRKALKVGSGVMWLGALPEIGSVLAGELNRAKTYAETNPDMRRGVPKNKPVAPSVNVNATANANYEKPLFVDEERFDVRDSKWKNVNERPKGVGFTNEQGKYANEYLQNELGTSYGFGDAERYKATSFEQLPTRLKNEYAMYGRPVETLVQQDSTKEGWDRFADVLYAADPTMILSLAAQPYFGNKSMQDFGKPVLGGKTYARTTLANAISKNPVSEVTGYGLESSRDGQYAVSANQALKAYQGQFSNEYNKIENDLLDLQNKYQTNPSKEIEDEYNKKAKQLQSVTDAYYALEEINGRVNSLKGLQKEIETAKATNNQAILNLLTKPLNFESLEAPMPALYDTVGYQSPLRRVTLSRTGDKYQNMNPYQLRGDSANAVQYGMDAGLGAGDLVGMPFGISPSGSDTASDVYDQDWMIGAALSRSKANEQPIFLGNDPRTKNTLAPIDPATGKPVADRIWQAKLANALTPFGDAVQGAWGSLFGKRATSKKTTKKKSSSIKKNSLTKSPLMPPMGNAPKANTMRSNSGMAFAKSLNPNPKPIPSVHPKHQNKYFK